MIKKALVLGALALWLGGGVNALACAAHAKEKGKRTGGCPMHADGAKAAATKGKTGCSKCAGHRASKKEAGKEVSAEKAGVYVCSMEDYAGPMTKDGRCPKCGMALSLKK